jgi:3-oxoacyl-[acyl-carrier protein] reductase
MDLGLKGKRALILAAAGGMGGGVGEALAAEGARVALFDLEAAKMEAHAENLRSRYGAEVIAITGDMSDAQSMENARQEAEKQFGGIDILVNNNPGPPPGPLSGVEPDVWQRWFEIMVLNIMELTRNVLPGMRERQWGRVLTIASSSVIQPIPALTISNVLRSALVGWSKTLSGELAKEGITVNMIVPGRIHTDRVDQIDGGNAKKSGKTIEEIRQASWATIPMGRYGTVAEFADTVAYLASERASYITGSITRVDGGNIRSV